MKNLKSVPKTLILAAFITIIIASIFYTSNIFATSNKPEKSNKSAVSANIIDMQNTIEDALNNGDIIVSGKIKSSYSYELYDVIFTNYVVHVNSKFINKKNIDIPNEIEIRATGGNLTSKSCPFLEDVQKLTENDKYLFILKKVYPDQPNNNFYAILGGEFQGVFKLNDTGVEETIVKFNLKNKLEKDLINKNIKDILNSK